MPGRGGHLPVPSPQSPVPSPQSPVPIPRLLLVTYYFPPSGGAGVQRTLKFAKYLRVAGVEPVVLTVEAGAYPSLDPTLAADVPDGVEVVRTRALDPFGLYGALTGRSRREAVAVGTVGAESLGQRAGLWARANVFLPDARVGWAPFAARAARRIVRAGRADAVLTSGPPHSTHLVGLALRRALADRGVPWVADFRDPWTGINFYDELPMSRPARAFDAALERRVLRSADAVVTVSPTWARELEAKGGLAPGAVRVIQNGFDPEDFGGRGGDEAAAPPRPDAFTLVHVGSLYGSRNPEALWAAVAALRGRGGPQTGGPQTGGAGRLRVRLVGRVDDAVRASLARHGLADVVDERGVVTHAEAVAEMAAADLLFLSIEPVANAAGILTGKLYEYLASGRPVLALGPPDGDAARLLASVGGGRLVHWDDRAAVEGALADAYAAWERGEPPAGAPADALADLARPAQARALADLVRALRRGR